MLAQGRLSAARAVQLLLPIIDALATAHARGIVHRDLKPDNLMIALEQQRIQPKILDFGVAKLTDPRDVDPKLTDVGMVVGSPEYMSPEQARGRDDVDASADVWAMCVVLYEAITGSTPFAAANYNALLRAIVEDEPLPLVDHAAGDLALWEILKRGLAKDRRNRYGSIAELGRVLAGWLVTHGVFEDACGTSLEAKWLGATSDVSPVASGSGTTRALSAAFQPKVTHDSNPHATGPDSRGPFTATIPSNGQGRARTLQIALATCAVLSALAIGFARGPATAAPIAAARLTPVASSTPIASLALATATPAVSAALPISNTVVAHASLAPGAPGADESVATKGDRSTAHIGKALAKPIHPTPLPTAHGAVTAPSNGSPATAPSDVSNPAAKRTLDLLAPY